ncbi:hypothetical protein QCA50_010715 [Cerrena zonata]|uniref:SPK domain-containing protein n=1 Tax=Cerrena zonata TaxID=2478898 RepID=A0AAW0G7F3_9APHY
MSDSDSDYDIFYDEFVIDDEVLSVLDQTENAYPPSSCPVSSDAEQEDGDNVISVSSTSINRESTHPASGSPHQDNENLDHDFEDEYNCFPELFLTQEDNHRLDELERQFLQSQAHTASCPSPTTLAVLSPSPIHKENFSGSTGVPPPRSKKRKPLQPHNRSSSPIIISSSDEAEVKPVVPSKRAGLTRPSRRRVRYNPDDVIVISSSDEENQEIETLLQPPTLVKTEIAEKPVKRRKLNPSENSSGVISQSLLTGYFSPVDHSLSSGSVNPTKVESNAPTSVEVTNLRPIDKFFANFPTFNYRRHAPLNDEFARLRKHQGWEPRTKENTEMYGEFRNALIAEFNATYGMDENDIRSWQYLCTLLRIDPVPTSMERCREIVLSTHVNLVDLLDTHRTGKQVTIFETEAELRHYTIERKRFFPLDEARQGGVLKYLLRHILH